MRAVLLLAVLMVAGCATKSLAQASLPPAPPGAAYEGRAFTFTSVSSGIYLAVGTGALAVGSNAAVIVNDDDVLLVDSHVSPAAAWALLRELRELTPKPVRTVVVTHFHYDHAHGSQLYGAGVEIIGHEYTRQALLDGTSTRSASYQGLLRVLAQRDDSLRRQLATARRESSRADAERGLRQLQHYQAAVRSVVPTPPALTLSQQLTLHRGGREIRVLFLGRAHTGGDVVVHLPAERVLVTGDLVGSGLPYLGDGYSEQWSATLDRLSALDWDVMLPGHGPPVRDRARPAQLAALLRDFHRQATALLDAGLSPDDAEPRLDLRAHEAHFPMLVNRGSEDLRERLALGLWRLRELRQGAR